MLAIRFNWLLIVSLYGNINSKAQTLNTSSVTDGDVYVTTSSTLYFMSEESCRRDYPETRPCPPFPEDMFGFLHNYTNPRPIRAQEIEEVMDRCSDRVECCSESWNFHKQYEHAFFLRMELAICFCDLGRMCDGYNVTSNHKLYSQHIRDVYPTLRKFGKYGVMDQFRRFWKNYAVFKITLVILYSIVWIWGLVGNILVIITIFRFMNRQSVTNFFIANLSFGDVLVIGFALPFRALKTVLEIWLWADWLCKSVWFIYYTSLMVSSFTMTAMAVERYLVICHPMKAQYISTPGRAKKIIAAIWVAAISLSSVIVPFVSGDLVVHQDCQLLHSYNFVVNPIISSQIILYYILVVAFLIPLIIMITAYVKVGVSLHQSVKEAKAIRRDTNSASQDKHKLKDDNLTSRIQVVKMLIFVLVTFVVTWLPSMLFVIMRYHHIVQMFMRIGSRSVRVGDVVAGLTLMTFINSCLNPVLYALYSKSFRKGFSKCFSCCRKSMVATVDGSITATSLGVTTSSLQL